MEVIPGVDKTSVRNIVSDGVIDDEAIVTGEICSLGEFEICSIFFRESEMRTFCRIMD